MSKIARHCVGAGLLFCSLLGLWFVGIVPSLSAIIGIFLLLGFVATINYIKSSSVGKVAILFYIALIGFIILDAVYSLVPKPIKEEIGAIRRSETIKTAERLRQSGGETFQIIREQCKADVDKGLKDATDRLHQSTSPNKTDDLIQDIQKLEERREKCSNAILKLGEKGLGGKVEQEKNKITKEQQEALGVQEVIPPVLREKERMIRERDEKIKTLQRELISIGKEKKLSSSDLIDMQGMSNYFVGNWVYVGHPIGIWTSTYYDTLIVYKFTVNGFLVNEETKKARKYKFLSSDILQITLENGEQQKYGIIVKDYKHMQLTFIGEKENFSINLERQP